MTPERWKQIEEVFHAAAARPAGERPAFLSQACAGDESLRREVERLLASSDEGGSFLESPAHEIAARNLAEGGADSMVGQTVAQYKILSLLGAGGMGEVYLAQESKTGRRVALKLLPRYFNGDEQRVRRFRQEARAALALNHPNIVTIYEVGEVEGTQFIATEFIKGETLRARLSRAPLEPSAALDVALQVAGALAEAHEAGVVHRDIKPENVMLRPDGYVKVLDFGIAKLTERQQPSTSTEAPTMMKVNTDPGLVIGTAHYMSPEQARGAAVDERTDIWSLGVVLYEMVSGRAPFEGESAGEVIAAILGKEPPPLARYAREVPEALEEIVTTALTKDREERYHTARQMQGALRRLKQRLDAAAELERTTPPEAEAHMADARSGGEEEASATAPEPAARTAQSRAAHTTSSAEYVVTQISRHKKGAVLALSLFVVAAAAVAFGLYRLAGRKAPGGGAMKLTSLTSGGKVGNASIRGGASISPDGKYVVYETLADGQWALYVRQVSTGSNVQIVPPAAGELFGTTFSPDGEFVYYIAAWEKDKALPTLYRVPVLGGTPVKLLERVFTPVTFSPDGRRFAFLRQSPNESSLMAADVDGGGEQKLASHKPPEYFNGAPAWSPDGRVIACGVRTTGSSTPATVVEVAAGGGAERPVTSHRWGDIGRVLWLRDGSGMVLTASPELISQGTQLWHLSYPNGEARRITNDLNQYGTYSLGLTADDNTLVTVQTEVTGQIWVTAPNEDEGRARKLTDGRNEGWLGLAWTPDGKIVYFTQVGDSQNFWLMNGDGSGNRQLTADAYAKQDVAVSPDGRYLVFQSNRAGTWSLWRTDADGGNPKQLTDGDDRLPAFSPDGRWVVFVSTRSGEWTLWRVGIDGGAPVRLTDKSGMYPSVSPDGKLIAYSFPEEQANCPHWVGLIPFAGGQPVKTLELPPTTCSGGLRWTPDGRALLYVDTRNSVSNVWSQPVDGGKPAQLTNFKTLGIDRYALSPDGRQLACARWSSTSDVVLVKNFR